MELVDHLLTTYDGSVIDYSDETAPKIQLNEYLTLGKQYSHRNHV